MAITTRLALIVISAFRLLSEYESRAGTEKNIVLAKIGLRKASGERSTSCSLYAAAARRGGQEGTRSSRLKQDFRKTDGVKIVF